MDTIALARQLGHAIQEEEAYKNAVAAGDAVDADTELTARIAAFGEKRDRLAETTDKDKLDELDRELETLYNLIMDDPKMRAFEAAKHEFSELMERVMAIIGKSADGEDPDTAEPDRCTDDCCSCHDPACHHHHEH